MRVPPPPRRSRANIIPIYGIKIRSLLCCHRLKRRWHLHKLRKKLRLNSNNKFGPISGPRAEDMMDLQTGYLSRSIRKKPLLIASFPRGCDNSPEIKVLQRSNFAKQFITKRKYYLKQYENKLFKTTADKVGQTNTFQCAQTVRTIKTVTSKNADVRTIFHNQNVLKRVNIEPSLQIDDYKFIIFDSKNSFRLTKNKSNIQNLKDSISLTNVKVDEIKPLASLQDTQQKTVPIREHTSQPTYRKSKKTTEHAANNVNSNGVNLYLFSSKSIISYSKSV
ncbi:hypothetical protein KAFR_0B03090 [Kazachstania africana CBS 2517]|uniref:Uncharacterized protein n=1 Tax=Kazachstania africana (strain ATCC 22294 / BCRC 22015 / CBS 2517 / CECT 1963 / NBRC 1671 / NRRL Y-8276) TaxID=1071382 RepID=H2AQF5_KAZAF|nr:hypothetical protein KAFR_0B03090 [Kazachstania africana CBS 2517]CCF56605.1 hypothetical protein KAFR_0B03090 [Kazachstania africana CBS 2517]